MLILIYSSMFPFQHMDLTLEFGSKAKKRSINSKLKYDSQVDSGHSLEGFIAGMF